MQKQKIFKTAIFVLLPTLVMLFTGCKSSSHSNAIMKVYVADGKQGTILFDTESKKGQVLIEDPQSVFSVMQTSLSQEWAVVSKMPADPEEARGVNEEKLLFYVPQKRVVYNPKYGNRAYLIAIETKGTTEEVQWMVGDETVTMPLNELQKVCLENSNACSATSGSHEKQEILDSTSENGSEQGETILNTDSIVIDGWLKPTIPQDIVIAHLGEPDSKGEDRYWGATGTYVQQWNYKSKGLQLNMESDSASGPKTVRSIIIDSTSTLKTPEGVGIGTDYNTVKTAYAGKIDTETSNDNMIVVGSVYGGITIYFENNKVRQIFIGAGAE